MSFNDKHGSYCCVIVLYFTSCVVDVEQLVRSLENADKNFKSLDKWIENIRELHKTKPATTVHYSSLVVIC